MRGVYTVNYRIAAIAAAKTLIYVTVPSGQVIEMLRTEVSDESNETNEQCVIAWQRITTLGSPTATTVVPAKHEKGDQAPVAVWKANVTASEPTYGAIAQAGAIVDAIGLKGFPSLGSYLYTPTPEERVYFASADSWGLRLINTPTAFDISIEATFREIG